MRNIVTLLNRRVLLRVSNSILVECHLKVGDKKIMRRSIEHPGCVVIIPKIGANRYLMVKQYRYAARAWIWEFPAGGIEQGESVRGAAQRELAEEAGFVASKLDKLISFFPTPGISEEKMHLFFAQDLQPFYAEKDEDEEFELKKFSLSQIGKMIKSGEIEDAKTIIGYFLLLQKSVKAN